MDNKLEELIKRELSYDDEQLNKIYRITEEDSYEEYEPETKLSQDLLAIRLAEKNSNKFEKYFKNANKNDVLNDAYQMSSKEKIDLMITHGDLFKYNNNFEKEIIDYIIRVIKSKGYIYPIDTKKLYNNDIKELEKLIKNEINSILVTDAICAELRNRYNLNFKLFTNSAIDKKEYINNNFKIEEFIRNFYNSNSITLGGYIDFINKIAINTSVHNKLYLKDNIGCQQSLLKTLYHEIRHAITFKNIKNQNIDLQEYLIAKNYSFIQKNPIIYKFKHDYFEAEIDATDFAEKQVKKDFENSKIKITQERDITKNRYTQAYDDINNVTINSDMDFIMELVNLEKLNLNELIKILYNDNKLSYALKNYLIKMSIKNNNFATNLKLSNEELKYLKSHLETLKDSNQKTLNNISYDPYSNTKYNEEHFIKEQNKVDKILKKL